MPVWKIFMLRKLTKAFKLFKEIFCNIFEKYFSKMFHFSKVVGCRWAVGVWTPAQTFLKDFHHESSAYIVVQHLSFRSANLKSS